MYLLCYYCKLPLTIVNAKEEIGGIHFSINSSPLVSSLRGLATHRNVVCIFYDDKKRHVLY